MSVGYDADVAATPGVENVMMPPSVRTTAARITQFARQRRPCKVGRGSNRNGKPTAGLPGVPFLAEFATYEVQKPVRVRKRSDDLGKCAMK